MNGKTKSIILQVAFKEAAAQTGGDATACRALTSTFYTTLIELHESLGINPDEGGGKSWGGKKSYETGAAKIGGGFTPPADAVNFTHAGAPWVDYSASKESGSVKPRFPDFKTADGKESVYIYDQNGTPTTEGEGLVASAGGANAVASLTEPF